MTTIRHEKFRALWTTCIHTGNGSFLFLRFIIEYMKISTRDMIYHLLRMVSFSLSISLFLESGVNF